MIERLPTASDVIYGVLSDHARFLADPSQRDLHESARLLQWEIDHEAVRRASQTDSSDIYPPRSAAEFEIAQQLLKKGVVTALAYRRNVPQPLPSCPWPVEGKVVEFKMASTHGAGEVAGRAFRCGNAIYAVHPELNASGAKWFYVVTHVATGQPLKGVTGATAEDAEAAARRFLACIGKQLGARAPRTAGCRNEESQRMSEQDMCPICVEPFKEGEVLVQYVTWGKNAGKLGHFDCVMALSKAEERNHPPA